MSQEKPGVPHSAVPTGIILAMERALAARVITDFLLENMMGIYTTEQVNQMADALIGRLAANDPPLIITVTRNA